jgi:hypothetical protein
MSLASHSQAPDVDWNSAAAIEFFGPAYSKYDFSELSYTSDQCPAGIGFPVCEP